MYKGRLIQVPTNGLFRPTKARVREALFNILGSQLNDTLFLDLCAGSGSIGLEAESRGATVTCVDQNLQYLKQNIRHLNAKATLIQGDVSRFLKRCKHPFDIIFLDPVWADHDTYTTCIDLIFNRQLLRPKGRLVIEHDRTLSFDACKTYQYGHTYLSLLTAPPTLLTHYPPHSTFLLNGDGSIFNLA